MKINEMITLQELAKLTDVSVRTVCRALQENGYVKKEVRERIQKVAKEKGYRPNKNARDLKIGKTHLVELVIPHFSSLQTELISHLDQKLREAGYHLEIYCHRSEGGQLSNDGIEEILDRRPAGVVLVSSAAIKKTISLFEKQGVPCLVIGQPSNNGVDFVDIDRKQGMAEAVKHLVAQGRQRIIYCGHKIPDGIYSRYRIEGYLKGMADGGLEPSFFHIDKKGSDFSFVRGVAKELLARHSKLDAIVAYTDSMAMGLMAGFHDLGVKIPQDIAVMGFDAKDAFRCAWPPLSSIAYSYDNVGIALAELLLEKINSTSRPRGGFKRVVPPRLIVREST